MAPSSYSKSLLHIPGKPSSSDVGRCPRAFGNFRLVPLRRAAVGSQTASAVSIEVCSVDLSATSLKHQGPDDTSQLSAMDNPGVFSTATAVNTRKRARSRSPSPQRTHSVRTLRPDDPSNDGLPDRRKQESFAREQTRLNQIQEAEQMRQWVSREDDFVLKQAKTKAKIRVKDGRAKPIDWLAVTLSVIDPTRDLSEEDNNGPEVDVISPDGVFEGMDETQLRNLENDIDMYIALESNKSNGDYWKVCW